MTKQCSIIFFIFLSNIGNGFGLSNIDKYLKLCDRNSPEANECLVNAIQNGLAVMSDGIGEYGVPPIDPYYQKEIRVEYKRNQITAKMSMKNIYVHGMKMTKVHDVRLRAEDDHFYLEIDLTTPHVLVEGIYHGEGSYNSLQINTTGAFNTTMTDLVYTWKLNGTPLKMDNNTYIKIDSFYMRPDVGDLKAYLSNDDPNTREINPKDHSYGQRGRVYLKYIRKADLAIQFANSNWKAVYRELLPFAQVNWNKIGIRVANKLFLKVPYDQLFPMKS